MTVDLRYENELTRLLAKGLTPEEETLARRYYSQKERDSMDESDFAGPHQSFPIKTQQDVENAARLIGHADDPDAVKAAIKRIAKRKGFTLPESWQDESDDAEDRTLAPTLIRADGNHEPMTGSHTHNHPAFSSQGDDSTHEHEHSHSGDANHDHSHGEDRADMPTTALLYAPIVRVNKEKREVEGVATSETVDSFGTIFSYEASKKAFRKWMEKTPNVREMHERKAAGKGILVRFDDAARQIHVRTFVSRGAQDTWLKVEDGVLNGYSVGAVNPVWDTVERDGKKYPYLVSYDLTELSLVDRASNPDAQGLVIARADGLTELVDITPDDATPQTAPTGIVAVPPVVRAGARVSADTRASLHDARNSALASAKKLMDTCGCDDCMAASDALDPDQDGDIDWMGMDDPDGDAAQLSGNQDGDMDRAVTAALERVLPGVIERVLAPVYQRQQQFLARMAQTSEQPEIILPNVDTSALEERLTAAIERVAASSSQSEVRAELSAVRETVERIAAQPMPGGPVLNGAWPVEKHLANDPRAYANGGTDQATVQRVLDHLQASGALNTVEAQTAAASLMIQPMPGRRG